MIHLQRLVAPRSRNKHNIYPPSTPLFRPVLPPLLLLCGQLVGLELLLCQVQVSVVRHDVIEVDLRAGGDVTRGGALEGSVFGSKGLR